MVSDRGLIIKAIQTPLIDPGINLSEAVISALKNEDVDVEDGDILVIASKIVSISQNRIIELRKVKACSRARELSKKYKLKPEFVEVVLREADEVLGGVYKAILTLKDGMLVANSGADLSNTLPGHTTLWPKNPRKTARELKLKLESYFNLRLGMVIADSRTTPLRLGTTGLAIAVAGFEPIIDYRGKPDLYGRPLYVTTQNVADDLASAAHLVMGEGREKKPLVLIRGHGVPIVKEQLKYSMKIPWKRCLYLRVLRECFERARKNRRY